MMHHTDAAVVVLRRYDEVHQFGTLALGHGNLSDAILNSDSRSLDNRHVVGAEYSQQTLAADIGTVGSSSRDSSGTIVMDSHQTIGIHRSHIGIIGRPCYRIIVRITRSHRRITLEGLGSQFRAWHLYTLHLRRHFHALGIYDRLELRMYGGLLDDAVKRAVPTHETVSLTGRISRSGCGLTCLHRVAFEQCVLPCERLGGRIEGNDVVGGELCAHAHIA